MSYDRELTAPVIERAPGGDGRTVTIPTGTRVRIADEYHITPGYVALRNAQYTFVIRAADLDRIAPVRPYRVRAWECTREGHVGMLVYDQGIALSKLGEGFNIEIVAITRYGDGRAPLIERGVIA